MTLFFQIALYVLAGFGLLCAVLAVVLPKEVKTPAEPAVAVESEPKVREPIRITNLRYLPRQDDDHPELPRGA